MNFKNASYSLKSIKSKDDTSQSNNKCIKYTKANIKQLIYTFWGFIIPSMRFFSKILLFRF